MYVHVLSSGYGTKSCINIAETFFSDIIINVKSKTKIWEGKSEGMRSLGRNRCRVVPVLNYLSTTP
jgi:hypothetical protein